MKYPNSPPQGRPAMSDHALPAVEMACRESLDDLKNGRVEPMSASIDALRARLKDMRGN